MTTRKGTEISAINSSTVMKILSAVSVLCLFSGRCSANFEASPDSAGRQSNSKLRSRTLMSSTIMPHSPYNFLVFDLSDL